MEAKPKTGTASFLEGLGNLLFGMAGLSFLIGGGLIHAVAGTDRMIAEFIGIGLAAVFCGLGVWAKSAADDVDFHGEDGKLGL